MPRWTPMQLRPEPRKLVEFELKATKRHVEGRIPNMANALTVWKQRLTRIAERMSKAVDCDLIMIRNTGTDIELWNATYSEACNGRTLIQLREWGHVGLGSLCLFLSPTYGTTPNPSQMRALFEAAGLAMEIIPDELKSEFDPMLFRFPDAIRWAGALVQKGFKGLPGASLKTGRHFAEATRSEHSQISEATNAPPSCWYSIIPNVLASSVDLIDTLICGDLASEIPVNETSPVDKVKRSQMKEKVTVKAGLGVDMETDGPVGTDTFRIDGILLTGVSRNQMRFLDALLRAKGRAVDVRDLIGPGNVWQDNVGADENAIGGMRTRINKLFKKFSVNRVIATADSYRQVELKSVLSQNTKVSAGKDLRLQRARKKSATRP